MLAILKVIMHYKFILYNYKIILSFMLNNLKERENRKYFYCKMWRKSNKLSK